MHYSEARNKTVLVQPFTPLMKLNPTITLLAAGALTFSASANIVLFELDFEDASSVDAWTPASNATADDKAWLDGLGNPGGALGISGTNDSDGIGAAFIFTFSQALDFGGVSEATLTFDAMITDPLVGTAFHFQTNTMGPAGANNPQNFFDIQNQGLNDAGFSPVTLELTNIPSNADTIFLSYNLAAGAFIGAGGGLAIDNIQITAVPEPSALGALLGVIGLTSMVCRRRRRA